MLEIVWILWVILTNPMGELETTLYGTYATADTCTLAANFHNVTTSIPEGYERQYACVETIYEESEGGVPENPEAFLRASQGLSGRIQL